MTNITVEEQLQMLWKEIMGLIKRVRKLEEILAE